MITPKRTINESVILQRERRLPISGISHVKAGEIVPYDKCVLATEIKGEIQVIRLSEKLGIDPESISDGLLIKEGYSLKKGDLIFERKSFFSFLDLKENSPVEGMVEFISLNSGHIGIRLKSKKLELQAFIPGEIKEVQKERTVILSSHVGLIQGIVGYGGEGVGRIHFFDNSEDEILDINCIKCLEVGNGPTILVGGKSFSEDFFNWANNHNIIGIVTSSIDAGDVKNILKTSALGVNPAYASNLPTVVIIEGFGSIPLSKRSVEFFRHSHGKLASINGLTQVRAGAIRPELIVHEPLLTKAPVSETLAAFPEIGDSMRIVRGRYFGKVGRILEIPKMIETLESGVETHVAILELDQARVSVSLANLESL